MTTEGGSRRGIHRYVSEHVAGLGELSGLTVVDLPAGDGRTSRLFAAAGAKVRAFDLMPEYCRVKGVEVGYADMNERLPIEDEAADIVVCQEGIEHVPDQLGLLRELNRILKPGGRLLLTTPSISNLRARLSGFLFETDFWRRLPPTVLDSVWFSSPESERVYFGHLFLLQAHKLETLAAVAGFHTVRRLKTTIGTTSALLFPFAYPFLVAGSLLTYASSRRAMRRFPAGLSREVRRRHLALNLAPTTLLCKHLFWVIEKRAGAAEQISELKRFAYAEKPDLIPAAGDGTH